MKFSQFILLFVIVFLMGSSAALAQIEKAVVETSGMRSCDVCQMALQVALSRVPGAEKVALNMDKQTFTVIYKPNTPFHPKDLRQTAENAKLKIREIQITAHGTAQDRDGYQSLAAGPDRYVLTTSRTLPLRTPLQVTGIVDDLTDPYLIHLKVLSVRELKKDPEDQD